MSTAPAASTGFTQAMGIAGPVLSMVGMATIYFPSTSLILGAFFGANAYMAKKENH